MAQNTIRIMSFFKHKNLSGKERNPHFFFRDSRKKNIFSPKKTINRISLREQARLTQSYASVTFESFVVFARFFGIYSRDFSVNRTRNSSVTLEKWAEHVRIFIPIRSKTVTLVTEKVAK